MSNSPIGIVVPLDKEFEPYKTIFTDLKRVKNTNGWEIYETSLKNRTIYLIISDCGPANAAAGTERLIASYNPSVILHGGTAGSCTPDLLPGDLVVGSSYIINTTETIRSARIARGLHPSLIRFRRDNDRHYVDFLEADSTLIKRALPVVQETVERLGYWGEVGWPKNTPSRKGKVICGRIASADCWSIASEELFELNKKHEALCEDMESAYIAQVCTIHQTPFFIARTISDNEIVSPLRPDDVPKVLTQAGKIVASVIAAVANII